MDSWFAETVIHLARHPAAQGLVAAGCTLIFEDPTTVISGLLVAEGKMGFWTAFLGLSFGIALGDMGLYLLGRLAGPKVIKWGLVTPGKLDRAQKWFDRNMVATVIVSRFVPGMRIPAFVGAGLFRTSAWKYLGSVVTASVLWTLLLLKLTSELGEAVLPMLGRWRWPVALGVVGVFIGLQFYVRRRLAARST